MNIRKKLFDFIQKSIGFSYSFQFTQTSGKFLVAGGGGEPAGGKHQHPHGGRVLLQHFQRDVTMRRPVWRHREHDRARAEQQDFLQGDHSQHLLHQTRFADN